MCQNILLNHSPHVHNNVFLKVCCRGTFLVDQVRDELCHTKTRHNSRCKHLLPLDLSTDQLSIHTKP